MMQWMQAMESGNFGKKKAEGMENHLCHFEINPATLS